MAGEMGKGESSKLIRSYIKNFRIHSKYKVKLLNCFKLEEEMIRCLYTIGSFVCNNNDQYLVRTSYTAALFRVATCSNILIFITTQWARYH